MINFKQSQLRYLSIIFGIILILSVNSIHVIGQSFKHPGILNNQSELDFIKDKVKKGEQPWKQAFDNLKASKYASLTYTPNPKSTMDCWSYNKDKNGNYVVQCKTFVEDAMAAYTSAIIWYISEDKRYSTKSIEILNAWAKVYQSNTGSNARLNVSWAAPWFTNAAEILRHGNSGGPSGWAAADITTFNGMLAKFLPYVKDETMPGNNWIQSAIEAHFAIAVYTDNRTEFNLAVSRWKTRVRTYIYQKTDGPIPTQFKSAPIDGIGMETARDLGHLKLGVNSMMYAAQTAYEQGVDLFTLEQKRLSDFFELHGSWMTGTVAVPSNVNGGLVKVGESDTYGIKPPNGGGGAAFEIAYNHLHTRLNKSLPFTATMIARHRPAGIGQWVFKPETLTHGNLPFTFTNPTVAVLSVSINATSTTMTVGQTKQLTSAIVPSNATNKSLTYSSSNSSIATVSASGLVTATGVGTVLITVRTVDGNKTATVQLVVSSPIIAVSGISVTPNTMALNVGQTGQLSTSILPANATNKSVSYSSANPLIATVSSSGLVTGKAAGSVTITAKSADGSKVSTSIVTVSTVVPVNAAPTVSISASATSYTAPATLKLIANAADTDGSIASVDLYLNGVFVRQEKSAPYEWNYSVNDLPISNLVAGTYIIKAIATDNLGKTAESSLSIVVNPAIVVNPCTGNTAPTSTILSPAANGTYTEGNTLTISADATDNGSIAQVSFFNGTTLLGTSSAKPYSITLATLQKGTYSITAVAKDNCGATTTSAPLSFVVNPLATNTDIIIGANCTSANTNVTYELSYANKIGAIGYSWWFSGSQATVVPVSGNPSKATVTFTGYYSGGDICVGVNYTTAPYYTQYCKPVGVCGAKLNTIEESVVSNLSIEKAALYPNPISSDLLFIESNEAVKKLEIKDEVGILAKEMNGPIPASGISIAGLPEGTYLVRIVFENEVITKKLMIVK